jgi:hypothetical protein
MVSEGSVTIEPPPPLGAERATLHALEPAFVPHELDRRAPRAKRDPLATLAVVFAIVQLSIVAIVVAHICLRRLSRTEAEGRGLARVALVAGYVELVIFVAVLVVYFAVLAPIVTLP